MVKKIERNNAYVMALLRVLQLGHFFDATARVAHVCVNFERCTFLWVCCSGSRDFRVAATVAVADELQQQKYVESESSPHGHALRGESRALVGLLFP